MRPDWAATSPRPAGWFAARPKPGAGLRPTFRFAIAFTLTALWVGFSVWVSDPWRDELGDAIGPVMAWVIPLCIAYIPGLVIGFMAFTLLITRYREAETLTNWPPVTVVVAARNEEDAIEPTLERIADLACAGALVPQNAYAGFITRMQQWAYRLGINGVKRTQAAYNSALVAQGAFSAYWTEDLWQSAAGPTRSARTSS